MTQVPDFTDTELGIVQSAVNQRYRKEIRLELADTECRLDPATTALTSCPAVFWREQEMNFVIMKTAEKQYRCQFFGRDLDMYGTGRNEYDDVKECTMRLLQAQADSARALSEEKDEGFAGTRVEELTDSA
uniref:Uncharacterized protein n=1 Tax=Candidatus Kentrum sp. SD TaxID=2126332 RepID=A0A451BQD7_9GAMM|nr:MAG: hypothetical protein BECKSD772F_GA0070984_12131 [Candidatus Kentron sp. SD]VFK48609.1 MAG: hypothetical protein BECKSD772E_GA0070983_11325 [Candidatus Kentron sp. SD]VFK80531.1 MAG: hypothetical protein BECKSD772D_GA0070982_11244 [Candidatus Kentron sp. SD]